jgi:hypothetical protein
VNHDEGIDLKESAKAKQVRVRRCCEKLMEKLDDGDLLWRETRLAL